MGIFSLASHLHSLAYEPLIFSTPAILPKSTKCPMYTIDLPEEVLLVLLGKLCTLDILEVRPEWHLPPSSVCLQYRDKEHPFNPTRYEQSVYRYANVYFTKRTVEFSQELAEKSPLFCFKIVVGEPCCSRLSSQPAQ